MLIRFVGGPRHNERHDVPGSAEELPDVIDVPYVTPPIPGRETHFVTFVYRLTAMGGDGKPEYFEYRVSCTEIPA